MITSVFKSEPIQGLSKREQIKLERVIKREQINKTKAETKTFKRKASKGPQLQEPKPRKLNTIQQNLYKIQGQEKSIMISSQGQQLGSPNTTFGGKKNLKTIKPFNAEFPVEGGQQGLFEYMLGYVSNMKLAQMESSQENLDFIDEIEGKELEIIASKDSKQLLSCSLKQLEVEKNKITKPFDQGHKNLLQKLQIKQKN